MGADRVLKLQHSRMDRHRIGGDAIVIQALGKAVLRWQRQGERAEIRVKACIAAQPLKPVKKGGGRRAVLGEHINQNLPREGSPRLPTVERVRVMGQQQGAIFKAGAMIKDHGGGKAPQDRQNGLLAQPAHNKRGLGVGQLG